MRNITVLQAQDRYTARMQAFVLAGGFATRLWPLTEKRAKPLLPLAGKPIVEYLTEQIPEQIPVTVSTNAAFKEGFTVWQNSLQSRSVELAIEHTEHDDQKLGALGAVAQWIQEKNVEDDILLLTGDNYVGFGMQTFLDAWTPGTPLLAAYDIGETGAARAFGTVILKSGTNRVQAFEEKPAHPKTTLVSTGCSILPKESLSVLMEFAAQHPDNVGGIFEELLRRNWQIDCFSFSEPWFDIGSFDAYINATKALVGDRVITGKGANSNDNHCESSVIIGENCNVRQSSLKDVVLFPGSTVENCVLERCIVDSGCTLRGIDLTGKMLREGTTLVRPDR